MATTDRQPIVGSDRAVLPGARLLHAADPNESMFVTVVLRRRTATRELPTVIEEMGARLPHMRQSLEQETFARTYGADSRDIEKVETFAHDHDLEVVEVQPAQRRIVLSGTAAAMRSAFGVSLSHYAYAGGTYRGRTGPIHIPTVLGPIIQGVFGLDNRPQARPHFRILNGHSGPRSPQAQRMSYAPPQIASLYNFPEGRTGSGHCIAIIELGGGYRRKDLEAYFADLDLPLPRVRSRSVDGGHNRPEGNPDGADGEVLLDVEVAGAVAPGAKLVVYFAPNTDAGFLNAVTTAIHDPHYKPSVISISWGAAESQWTLQAMQAMDQAFQDAAALGITVCCASGDDGSTDNVADGRAHVDFPASSPYALGCGGTRLEGQGTTIFRESVWHEDGHGATGGGVSEVFAPPAWQVGAKVPPSVNAGGRVGRGVPDVAGDADPLTGYQVLVDGKQLVIGGTSAVAPLWAGLITLMNQQLGRPVGYINPLLYGLPRAASVFHDIKTGSNGAYSAQSGWDACTGLGTPDGVKLVKALSEG
ncbi:MAG: protease pro-enzyme activation domain-containing protein [Candidatus Binatia bacterium]